MSTKAKPLKAPAGSSREPVGKPTEEPVRQSDFTGWVLGQNQLAALLLTAALLVSLPIGIALSWFHNLPDIRSVADYRPLEATLLLDRNLRPVDAIGSEFRIVIPYEAMPSLLPQAFVAAEDSRFWEHKGLDGWSIARAAVNNLISGRKSQGGSTITQQVTRALLLSPEKSYSRKMAEAILAHRLESMLGKKDILYIYLNQIYLGEGAYGVEAAALAYFGKRTAELSLGQIALLAGLPQSPSNYSPLKRPEAARARQRYVLNRMAEDGLISSEEAREAFEQPLDVSGEWRQGNNGAFTQFVRRELLTRYSEEDLLHQGLCVITTLDSRLQQAAVRAVQAGTVRVALRHDDRPPPQAALVAVDSAGGRVRAMVGGTDFRRSQYNRALQARRQPGSSFKPLIYAAALESGLPANTLLEDTPLTLPAGGGRVWRPANYNNEYRGNLDMAEALVRSSNVGTVRLLRRIGVQRVVTLARNLGIEAPLESNLSLALGTSPLSPVELCAAYTAFANHGVLHPATAITRIRSRDGGLSPWPQTRGRQVLRSATADWVREALMQAVVRGTGRNAAGPAGAAGKTGTTDDQVDAWFIGFTDSGLTTAVWLGHDHNQSLGLGETGGRAAATVWRAFMLQAQQGQPEEKTDDVGK